jgi:hypothetical protein
VARPLWQWLAWRFIVAGVLPLLLVAALLLQLLLPQVIAGIEARHEVLARAIAGQVEEYLRGAAREMSALAAYVGTSGWPGVRNCRRFSMPTAAPAPSSRRCTSLPATIRCWPLPCRPGNRCSATI